MIKTATIEHLTVVTNLAIDLWPNHSFDDLEKELVPSVLTPADRKRFIDYLKKEIDTFTNDLTTGQIKKWNSYKNNVLEGINYYQNLMATTTFFNDKKNEIQNQFEKYKLGTK